MKGDKDKIVFTYTSNRLFSDSRDTYYWLKLRDKKIAKEFGLKLDKMQTHFKKKLEDIEKDKVFAIGEMKYEVEMKDDIKTKSWWKVFSWK